MTDTVFKEFLYVLVHLSRRLKCTIVMTRCPSLTFHIFDFPSETAERNPTKLNRTQVRWSKRPLPILCFFRPIRKTNLPPWPLIGWDIFDFSSETAKWNSTKLYRKQDLNVLYQVCVFQADQSTKMAAPADPSKRWHIVLWRTIYGPFGLLFFTFSADSLVYREGVYSIFMWFSGYAPFLCVFYLARERMGASSVSCGFLDPPLEVYSVWSSLTLNPFVRVFEHEFKPQIWLTALCHRMYSFYCLIEASEVIRTRLWRETTASLPINKIIMLITTIPSLFLF